MGIVGVSRIGRRVIALLKPFDLTVQAHDPYKDATEAGALGVEKLELEAMIDRSDVLTLHAPALEATRHMIDARRLALMKDGAALIDHAAQERELVSGRISAVIDVTGPEVQPASSPLYTLPNVLLTPHIAGAVGNERQRLGSLALGEVERFVKGLPLEHAVVASTLHFQA